MAKFVNVMLLFTMIVLCSQTYILVAIHAAQVSVKTADQLYAALSGSRPQSDFPLIITLTSDIMQATSKITIQSGWDVTIKGSGVSGRLLRELDGPSDDGSSGITIPKRMKLGGSVTAPLPSGVKMTVEVLAGAYLTLENLEINTRSIYEEGVTNSGGTIRDIRGCVFYGPGNSIVNWNAGSISQISNSFFIHSSFAPSSSSSTIPVLKSNIRNTGTGATIGTIQQCSFLNANVGGAIENSVGAVINVISTCLFNQANSSDDDDIINKDLLLQQAKAAVALTGQRSAITNAGQIGKITSSTFDSLVCKGKGAAIYTALGGSIGSVSTCIFSQNIASEEGGAIYSLGSIDSITQSNFYSCAAVLNGGAIATSGLGVTIQSGITSCDFLGNYAGSSGGAINIRASSQVLIGITSCDFSQNNAGISGGAISLDAGSALLKTITKSTFEYNSAARGGAIQLSTKSMLSSITASTFTRNIATSFFGGGAIFISTASSPEMELNNNVFDSNTGSNGGAIRLFTDAAIYKISLNTFTKNIAEVYGGAVSNYGSMSYLQSNFFEANQGSVASAVHNDDAVMTQVDSNVFLKNFGGGVAFHNSVGTVDTVSKSLFFGNGGKGLSNQFYIRSITGCSFVGDIIISLGQDMTLSSSAFGTGPKCENQEITKTKCPVCKDCLVGPAAFCPRITDATVAPAKASYVCGLLPGCQWSSNACISTDAGPISEDGGDPNTGSVTPAPTTGPPVSCDQYNKIKSLTARASMCKKQTGCKYASKKCVLA